LGFCTPELIAIAHLSWLIFLPLKPVLHPSWLLCSGQSLIEAYVEMRKVGSGRGQVSAYPRQLESLIRLAEAHARMRLSDVVDVDDVQEARR